MRTRPLVHGSSQRGKPAPRDKAQRGRSWGAEWRLSHDKVAREEETLMSGGKQKPSEQGPCLRR